MKIEIEFKEYNQGRPRVYGSIMPTQSDMDEVYRTLSFWRISIGYSYYINGEDDFDEETFTEKQRKYNISWDPFKPKVNKDV